jgi:hypothetical protein
MKRILLIMFLVFLGFAGMTVFNNYGSRLKVDAAEGGKFTEAASDERSEAPRANADSSSRANQEKHSVFLTMFFSWGTNLAYYAIGIVFAVLIHRDARRRTTLVMNIGPVWWALIAVFDPALGVLAYWVIHYSKISPHATEHDSSV